MVTIAGPSASASRFSAVNIDPLKRKSANGTLPERTFESSDKRDNCKLSHPKAPQRTTMDAINTPEAVRHGTIHYQNQRTPTQPSRERTKEGPRAVVQRDTHAHDRPPAQTTGVASLHRSARSNSTSPRQARCHSVDNR